MAVRLLSTGRASKWNGWTRIWGKSHSDGGDKGDGIRGAYRLNGVKLCIYRLHETKSAYN
jgi:hypothetical protein